MIMKGKRERSEKFLNRELPVFAFFLLLSFVFYLLSLFFLMQFSRCKRQASLDALTLALTCRRKRERSGRWRPSGAALCWAVSVLVD